MFRFRPFFAMFAALALSLFALSAPSGAQDEAAGGMDNDVANVEDRASYQAYVLGVVTVAVLIALVTVGGDDEATSP